MLCVCASLARKSSTCGSSTAVFGPSETTVEKPTPLPRAQSRMPAVSAPDCDTSAIAPGAASGPSALAFRPSAGRWKPRLFGPSSSVPWWRAMVCSSSHCPGVSPQVSTAAARQRMRPTISSAAAICSAGSAISARSARDAARSASVPLMPMSSQVSVPV